MGDPGQRDQKSGGQFLKEAREAQGISLETVHAATKIPMDALKSIEEGYKVRTLTPFYVKGFMKMYAQFLGVDVNKILEDHHVEKLPAHIPDDKGLIPIEKVVYNFPKDRQKKAVEIIGVIILALVVLKVGAVVLAAKNQKKRAPAAAASENNKKKMPAAKVQNPAPRVEKKAVEKAPAEKKVAAAVAAETKTPKAKAPAVDEEETDEEKPAPVAKKVRLTIRATKSGWLQVKVDGNLVFQSTLEQGATETWTAAKEIELSGKNIHSLEFEVNGKVLGGLGRADRSARRVVVTESGLTVKNSL